MSAPILQTLTYSTEETITKAREFAAGLRPGDVVVVSGPIGAGKTYFVKGLALGLGVEDVAAVNSPTYDLVHRFDAPVPLFHIDFYRLQALSDEDRDWIDDALAGGGVCVIEWGEKFIHLLNTPYYLVTLELGKADGERALTIMRRSAGE